MKLISKRIGEIIEQYVKISGNPNLKVEDVSGVNREKEFFEPSQSVGKDTSKYKIVPDGYFACNLMHVGRDKVLPIAFNHSGSDKIVSPAYTVFKVTNDLLMSEYLFMMLKSSELDRYFWFHTDSSVRDGMSWEEFCNVELQIPSIEIQKKYVAVFKGIQENIDALKSGYDELTEVCDEYIRKISATTKYEKIGNYIQQTSQKNEDRLSLKDVRGISIEKKFIETKANMTNVSLKNYLVVNSKEFAYVPVTSRNGNKVSLAFNDTDNTYICSSSYITFKTKNMEILYPDYLNMFLSRTEFDRYARFNSWGSAREVFSFEDMKNVTIPIPSIETQKAIADINNIKLQRQKLAASLEDILNKLCPVLIKGSIEEEGGFNEQV